MRVALTQKIINPNLGPLDGSFYGWANPSGPDPESGLFPFIFDTPDYILHHTLLLPIVVDVQLAAFAYELYAFANQVDYDVWQNDDPKFAVESFIPAGLFSEEGALNEPPEAFAIFTGRILQTAFLTNPATHEDFYWVHVRTLGGDIDVVADPEIVEGALVEDGIIHGTFLVIRPHYEKFVIINLLLGCAIPYNGIFYTELPSPTFPEVPKWF